MLMLQYMSTMDVDAVGVLAERRIYAPRHLHRRGGAGAAWKRLPNLALRSDMTSSVFHHYRLGQA